VVLDGYHFTIEYQQAIISSGYWLLCIDDLHAWKQLADVVINYAEGIRKEDYDAVDYTEFFLGLNHVLLRPEFLEPRNARQINKAENLFISMGAADSTNLTE